MRVVELTGTARERGRQQGEALRAPYREMMSEVLGSELWRTHRPRGLPDGLLGVALATGGRVLTRGPVRRRLHGQFSRVRGLAEGLGISTDHAFGLQLLEVVFCEAGSSLALPGPVGCTVAIATPPATRDGRVLVGRNYDFPYLLQRHQVVRRERPTERGRYATTTLTQVPMAGAHQGVNERGLAVTANNARLHRGPHLRRRGTPSSLVLQEVLETCATTAEALRFLGGLRGRANAGFFGVADASGHAAVVEHTASALAVRPVRDGLATQANHFTDLAHANLPEGTRWVVRGMEGVVYLDGSRRRQDTALRVLRAHHGDVTEHTLRALLADHGDGEGADDTVCCHGAVGGTLSSMVTDLGARTVSVCTGPPCQGAWQTVPMA